MCFHSDAYLFIVCYICLSHSCLNLGLRYYIHFKISSVTVYTFDGYIIHKPHAAASDFSHNNLSDVFKSNFRYFRCDVVRNCQIAGTFIFLEIRKLLKEGEFDFMGIAFYFMLK